MARPIINKALAVGLLVAASGIAFLVAFTFFRKGGYSERDSYVVFAYFEDATGLTWKSRVQIAGIQVGEVSQITLAGNRARLDLRVKKDIDLHADACLTKRFPSTLLPDALLDVTPGTSRTPSLRELPPDQREVRCVGEAMSVARLLDTLGKLSTDVQGVTRELSEMVAGSQGSIREIIGNLARTSANIDRTVSASTGQIATILDNVEGFTGTLNELAATDQARYHEIVKNVQSATQRLDRILAGIQAILGETEGGGGGARSAAAHAGGAGAGERATAGGAEARAGGDVVPDARASAEVARAPAPGDARRDPQHPTPAEPPPAAGPPEQVPLTTGVAQARESIARLNHALSEIDKVATTVAEGKSAAGKLLVDERLGTKLSNAVEGVSDYIDRLTRLKLKVELRSEWLLNQSGAKTYAGLQLVPRPDKYYLFYLVSDPRGVTSQSVNKVVSQTPTGVASSTTTSTVNQMSYTVSLEFAKRYGPIAGRIGLIESSGGFGGDLFLLDDRLKISLDVFQFYRPDNPTFPRAKLWADYTFWKYVYFTTGTDDFLNAWKAGRYPGGPKFAIGNDVFFGGGIVFTDDDLKAIISAVGGAAAGGASSIH